MPGDKPKAQHFVQQKYLEAFCDPVTHEKTGSAVLWVHSANHAPRRQVPKECAVENYFYCHEDESGERSFLGERFLADLESASGDVVKAAQAGVLPRTLRDRLTLTGYVAMSLVRTPTGKKHIDQAAIDQSVQQMRDLVNDPVRHAEFCAEMEKTTGKRMDPEESIRKLSGGKVRAVQTNRGWSLRMMAEMMMLFQQRFMNMRLLLLHANDAFFVTSDCPVAVHDPATMPLLPRGFRSFEMRFPLSREYCLAGTYSSGPAEVQLPSNQVEKLNRFLVRQAARFVYAPFDAEYIQRELQDAHAKKIANQRDDVIQFFE
ncbi:MAG TPA: DUF4238 domain-containing protein [Edaphobacter sp.]|uniref:DUF4238 domain-containing protein n=1 Tax=Edaphobacter sp. TaxID=1934404 RepID=UPI002B6F0515|nr:DUF4238 domain-containing protein [Edaphobacter sp.]HUZ97186.1 DUF4238 domain-containing protein [Edaphobacter sp.]